MKHFIDLKDIELSDLQNILENAKKLKKSGGKENLLEKKQLVMIFEKESTRTHISFEAAINHLGGNAVIINRDSSQLGRGESYSDTAKVLSRYADLIMVRTFKHESLQEMAENSSIPVINGLTDRNHPCQVMADIMTIEEKKGDIKNKKIAWIGDINNMTNTWIEAAEKFNFFLNISCPEEIAPILQNTKNIKYFKEPLKAAKNAEVITTDTWFSMGDAEEVEKRSLLQDYQVNDNIMSAAKNDAIFMHCLPAHRDEEVSSAVLDGEQSVIFDEAENRLHIQKAIMLFCLDDRHQV